MNTCKTCGTQFTGRPNNLYCSARCSRVQPPTKKQCPACLTVFFGHNSQVYCSTRCRDVGSVTESINVCIECGVPTTNYRCSKCWASIRTRHDVPDDGVGMTEYSVIL